MDKKILYGIIVVLVIIIVLLIFKPIENVGGQAFKTNTETTEGSNDNLCYCAATGTVCRGSVIYLDGGTALDCSCCPVEASTPNNT
jgi:hypothetical protein